ncbi:hypothetical protein C5167_031331 [Papaver somniferum]|uniref:Uncharacterized protein n=1 Tax=Papaver somniferum TaxID=3469 RepID=A0A4Y7K7V2_PAPSO|nr:hypothetical protein C5167_031331 [Papaver somniferum]
MQHSAGWFPLITSVLLSMKKRHILSNITKIYKSAVYGLLRVFCGSPEFDLNFWSFTNRKNS